MHRLAALLLCCSLVVIAAVTAAPAPFPRMSRGPILGITGWDRPVDPAGDCSFDRQGDRLTITIPGPGHTLDVEAGRLNAPRMLRDVDGDFAVQVRVAAVRDSGMAAERLRAGLLVTDGKSFVRLQRLLDRNAVSTQIDEPVSGHHEMAFSMSTRKNLAYLRLERRGDHFLLLCSHDGRQWRVTIDPFKLTWPHSVKMARKVKVGVLAEATGNGRISAIFDQFHLTPPPKRSPAGLIDPLFDGLDG
jgi:regulation of enolase protein 1 (concanavalin A-like superfamily)